jgi:hypothetical protein
MAKPRPEWLLHRWIPFNQLARGYSTEPKYQNQILFRHNMIHSLTLLSDGKVLQSSSLDSEEAYLALFPDKFLVSLPVLHVHK